MTPIDYIKIDSDILKRQDLSNTEKMILGLIKNFNSKSLTMSNVTIGQLVGARPDTVSKIISKLQSQKDIKIQNAQSKYRRIYFGENSKVEERKTDSTLDLNPSTLEKNATYFGEKSKHNISNIRERVFTIPSLAAIEDYIAEKKLAVNGKKFLDYFTASDWVDSRGRKVRNWKQKLLTWDGYAGQKSRDITIDTWQPPTLEQVEQIKNQCSEQYAGELHGY